MGTSPFTMCPNCLKDIDKVRGVIVKKPYLSTEEISQLSNVSVEKIRKLAQIGFNRSRKSETNV